jgi:hypothetical protein
MPHSSYAVALRYNGVEFRSLGEVRFARKLHNEWVSYAQPPSYPLKDGRNYKPDYQIFI